METIKMFLLRMWHYIIFYVQDFDGLKDKLYRANRSYDSYYNNHGQDVETVTLKDFGPGWVVYDICHSIHHNPEIIVGQVNRISGTLWYKRVRMSDIVL